MEIVVFYDCMEIVYCLMGVICASEIAFSMITGSTHGKGLKILQSPGMQPHKCLLNQQFDIQVQHELHSSYQRSTNEMLVCRYNTSSP